MQSILRRIEIILLTGFLFFTVAGFFVPNQAAAQLKIKDPSTTSNQPLPVYSGVEGSLKDYLCVPGDTQAEQSTALVDCVGRLYRFSITVGGVTLVFFLVIAGYLYITSGEAGKGKAKGILLSSLTGMGILLGSYALLSFVNPDLVKIKPIQPPIFTATNLPSCEAVGFGTKCITSDGQISNPGGGTVASGQQIQGNGISCSLGDDKLASTRARCNIESRFQSAITSSSQRYGVEEALIKAIIQKESNWKEVITSWTGCCHGLMQVSTDTASAIGCQSGWQTDGVKNIDCGTKYLARLKANSAVNTSLKYIISAYNAGPGQKSQGPSSICSGLRVWECPFTNASKTACQTNINSYLQTRDYVVTVSRWYNEFRSCS